MPCGHSYTVDKQNGYMLAEYMQAERRGSALERTPNKREQNDLMNSGGFNRFMACQPRTYSQFLYDSCLASCSHVNCIQDKFNEHQNDETQQT